MEKVLIFQHVHCETPGIIQNILESTGITAEIVRAFEGEPIPTEMGDVAGLIVMGGPMGVYEHSEYPFLLDEQRLIEDALREEKPILGVCLGSQLLASVLGVEVTKGKQKEIGWYPITLSKMAQTDALWTGVKSPFTAYHWHGDIFELPQGGIRLASSELTECQAFRYGSNVYGFLFHMEVTREIISGMVKTFTDELEEASIDESSILEKVDQHLPQLNRIGNIVFQRWAGLIEK